MCYFLFDSDIFVATLEWYCIDGMLKFFFSAQLNFSAIST